MKNTYVLIASALSFGLLCPARLAAGSSYKFVGIADSTLEAPNGSFHQFGTPSAFGSSAVFWTEFDQGRGVFKGSMGSLSPVAITGDVFSEGTFSVFGSNASASRSGGAFFGNYTNELGEAGAGIFRSDGSTLTTIVKAGDSVPWGTINSFGLGPGFLSMDESNVAFLGRNDFNRGIFVGTGGPLTMVAATGDTAPIGIFRNFGGPVISGATTSFWANYDDGQDDGEGVFVGSGGAVTAVAKTGDAAPVGTFTGFTDPSISGDQIAFVASYGSEHFAIFTAVNGQLSRVVGIGDPAPLGHFRGFRDGVVSVDGESVAFHGFYNETSTGIFIAHGGQIDQVVSTGDELFGGIVRSLRFGRLGLDPSGTKTLAFYYGLEDGRLGIAIAMLVPEPSSLGVVLLVIAAGALYRPCFAH